jgi:exosortase
VLVGELYRHALTRSPASATALSLGTLCFIRTTLLQQWGPQTLRHFRFPILFALIAVPIPGVLWNPIVFGLKGLVTFVNVELLNLWGIPAQQQGSVIQLPNCRVGVDEACSGIRSLQSSLMMALFICNQALQQAPLRVLLVLDGALPTPPSSRASLTRAARLQHHRAADRLRRCASPSRLSSP